MVKWQGRDCDWKGNDIRRGIRSNYLNQKVFLITSNLCIPFFVQISHRLSFTFPLQSSCQPAMSYAAATAASWPETAPSVSALMASRSARTGRAAEVGPPSPLGRTFLQMNEQVVLRIWRPSVCRQGPHVQYIITWHKCIHTQTLYTEHSSSLSLSLPTYALHI